MFQTEQLHQIGYNVTSPTTSPQMQQCCHLFSKIRPSRRPFQKMQMADVNSKCSSYLPYESKIWVINDADVGII